jgi:hypothetical protein
MSFSGCTRRFFQRRADAEVDAVMAQKDKYPQWKLADYYIWPHPLSRFADPTDWNRPPMPPDDPAAWDLSPHPQRPLLRGYNYWQGTGYLELMRQWDEENRTKKDEERRKKEAEEEDEGEEPLLPGETKTFDQRAAEVNAQIERELNSPTTTTEGLPEDFAAALGKDKPKPFLLNLEQITELGFMNSREFQTNRESLYLTALALTAERFTFIAQPFFTETLIRERSGSKSVDGETNRWLSTTTTGFTKLFSTGALLLLNFANQTVYNLGSGFKTTSVSTINLDFVQPFLAGGGRAVVLEPLTQAERNLVYAIRDFYRLRQEFFVFFAAGQSTGFIPGVGAGVVALNPTTVTQPFPFVPTAFTLPLIANPATVQVAPGAGGVLRANLGAGVLTTPQGFLSTIGERATLVNAYKNIQALQRFLRLFEVYLEGGLVNQVQKGTVEQQLLRSIETTLGNHASYRISLDQLKQQLGLPMTVYIELDDSLLKPMIDLTDAYEKLSIDSERVNYNILQYGRMAEAQQLRQRLHRMVERTPLLRGTQTREQIRQRWGYWEKYGNEQPDGEKALKAALAKVNAEREELRAKRMRQPGEVLSEADLKRDEELYFDYLALALEISLRAYEKEPWKTQKDPVKKQEAANIAFRYAANYFIAMADRAVVERQEKIKKQWPALPAICAEGLDLLSAPEDEALAAAERATLNLRVDVMNVRGQLVDAWRKIRVAANALMGTFNVDYHLDASSPANEARPFALGGSRTRHELIFNGQLPIVRILQRNNYRSTLINFQQNRRNLMAYEDQLLFNTRLNLRQIRVAANNIHRVQKRAIELAYMQVDQALQAFSQPQAPPQIPGVPEGGPPPPTPQPPAGAIAPPKAPAIQLIGPVAPRPAVGDPAALTNQLLTTQSSLLSAQNDLYNTWIGYLITRMNFYRDLGDMRLDNRGVWIDEHATSCQCNAPNDDNRQPAGEQRSPERKPEQQQPSPEPELLPQPRPEPAAAQGQPMAETR